VTEIESVDRPVPLEDGGTWRMLLMQLRRDRGGNPESFLFAYALTRVPGSGEYQDGVPTRHQSRKTESFLRGWRGAMNHWASHNVDALKKSLWRQRDERDRSIRLRPVSGCVLVTLVLLLVRSCRPWCRGLSSVLPTLIGPFFLSHEIEGRRPA
jgi:hypothetical protein